MHLRGMHPGAVGSPVGGGVEWEVGEPLSRRRYLI